MAGICNTCIHFKADVNSGSDKPHLCAFQNLALSEEQSLMNCPECKKK